MKETKRTVYIALDGTEFENKDRCLDYEKQLAHTHYYLISCDADLTEGRFEAKPKHILKVYLPNTTDKTREKIVHCWCEHHFGVQYDYPSGVFSESGPMTCWRFVEITEQEAAGVYKDLHRIGTILPKGYENDNN